MMKVCTVEITPIKLTTKKVKGAGLKYFLSRKKGFVSKTNENSSSCLCFRDSKEIDPYYSI